MKARKNFVVWERVEKSNRKNWDIDSENMSPLNFAKYLSYSEVQKSKGVINNWNRFQQVGSLF